MKHLDPEHMSFYELVAVKLICLHSWQTDLISRGSASDFDRAEIGREADYFTCTAPLK